MSDLISRADAIGAVHEYYQKRFTEGSKWDADAKMFVLEDKTIAKDNMEICNIINALPSADARVSDYAKWLEGIIVKAETLEWLCEDTNDKEWCDENCHYSSLQAECLRHLYEVSKGGDDE